MKEKILALFAVIAIAIPMGANAKTITIVCGDGSVHQRETVTPDYFQDSDDKYEAADFYLEFAELVCNGEA